MKCKLCNKTHLKELFTENVNFGDFAIYWLKKSPLKLWVFFSKLLLLSAFCHYLLSLEFIFKIYIKFRIGS